MAANTAAAERIEAGTDPVASAARTAPAEAAITAMKELLTIMLKVPEEATPIIYRWATL
jgi:hypothetical protein